MNKIDQNAIKFFTTPWELSNSSSRSPLSEKVGLTILSILSILVLGIIVPLITCWIIKLQMVRNNAQKIEVQHTDLKHDTTIEKIGNYAAVVNHANPKIQELFDWFLESSDCPGGLIILDLESRSFSQHISSSTDSDPITEAYIEKMKELAPSLIEYFGEVITQHAGHNKMVISAGHFSTRHPQYMFHQDRLGTTFFLNKAKLFNVLSKNNVTQWSNGHHKQEGLMLVYKKSSAGHILPTTVAKTPENFKEHELRSIPKDQLESMKDNGDMACIPMEEHQVLVINNSAGIHATTNYDGAEVFLGEGEGLKYFDKEDHSAFTEDIKKTPLFRITASTFASD